MKQKNILLVAPPFIPVSKDSVAGIEQMVYSLGRALVELGNNVFTIAREDSEVPGTLIPGGFANMASFKSAELEHFHQGMAYTTSQVRMFIRENQGLDAIIDRCQGVSLITGQEENSPLVICSLDMESKYFIHPILFEKLLPVLRRRNDQFAAVARHVAEEYLQKLPLNDLSTKMHTIYNGIVTENFPFSNNPSDYLLYLGRIREGKAPHLAIQAAIESGHKIIVAGGNIPGNSDGQYEDKEYFDEHIKPLLNQDITFFGPANLEQKVKLMQGAKALLFPSQHREAQPLVPLEAMSCGTPVIAFKYSADKENTGASEEIVDGETGFLVDSYDGFVNSINHINEIDRQRCSEHVRTNFDYRKMGREYMQLINSITH